MRVILLHQSKNNLVISNSNKHSIQLFSIEVQLKISHSCTSLKLTKEGGHTIKIDMYVTIKMKLTIRN